MSESLSTDRAKSRPNSPWLHILILGIDRFISEARAISYIIGNTVAMILISHSEQELDRLKLHAELNSKPTTDNLIKP